MLLQTAILTALACSPASASYAFYVGKNLTSSNTVLIGGTGEEVSSHWLQLFPAAHHPPNATITVGVTQHASIPGELIQIPQVNRTFRYVSMEYSDFEGFPAPLTNGGLSEMGVAVRDVWAENRRELVDMTPIPQRGLQYSDLARIVLERARTAREGVEIIGDLIAKYGESTYGGNTHLIADKDEGWIVWEMAGGKGLWAAQRLGPNEVKVLYPGYIEDFPVNFASSEDYMGSDNIISFAVEQGWWDPNSGKPFNIFNIYGPQDPELTARDGGFKYMSQAALENATLAMVPVTEMNLMERVRDPRIADDQAGYGQVISLRDDIDPDLLRIWIAPTSSIAAPFMPWWLGVQSIPPEYSEHRYLTTGASSSFLNPDYQHQEATIFAGWIFKRILYYMCTSPDPYLPLVTAMLTSFEAQSMTAITSWVETSAELLISNNKRLAAQELLTYYSHTRAAEALALGRTTGDSLDGYLKLTGQWRGPRGREINDPGLGDETVNCLVGIDPDKPPNKQKSRRGPGRGPRRGTQERMGERPLEHEELR